METYLDQAIRTYRKIATLDFTMYGEFVLEYLKVNNVETLDDIELFKQLTQYVVMDSDIYCKQTNDGKYLFEPELFDDAVKLGVDLKIIRSKVEELNPSVLFGTFENVLSIFEYIKQVREKYPSPPGFNKEGFDEISKQLSDDIKQALIYLAVFNANKKTREKIIEKWNIELFSYFSKSILNAEYLILDNYKKRLDEIEKYFDEKGDESIGDETGRKMGRFYTEKAFLRVSWYLQEACSCIKRYLKENQESNLLLVNSDRKKRFRRKEIYKNKYFCADKTKFYEALLESIIQMTIIDHYFRSDAETVEKLFHLYEQVKELKVKKAFFNENELFTEVIDEVLAKVATMLDLILNSDFHQHTDQKIDVDYYYIINSRVSKDDFIKNELAQYCKRDTSENIYISDRKLNKGKEFKFKEVEFEYNEQYSDLKLYYDAVTTGMKAYYEQSKIISKVRNCINISCVCIEPSAIHENNEVGDIKNTTDETVDNVITDKPNHYTEQEVVDAIRSFVDDQPSNLSPSFFRQVLEFIDMLISKEKSKPTAIEKGKSPRIREYHFLLKKVLNLLSKFLNKFVSDIPFAYRPYFEYSFYSCCPEKGIIYKKIEKSDIEDYKVENFKGKFFFASIDCMPINYLYLTKLYNKFKILHKELVYNFDERSRENLRKEFDSLSEKVETTLDDKTKEVDDKVKEELDKTTKSVEDKLEETSKDVVNKNLEHMVVSLGIFAAFIAFVTISINLVKVAQNIWQFIVFSCTFSICLLLFVVCLKPGQNITSHVKKRLHGPWKAGRIFKYAVTLVSAISVMIGIMFLTSKLPVFNVDLQLQRQDSIIDGFIKKEKQMLIDYELLLKDYKVLKAEKDSLRVKLFSPVKDTIPNEVKTKKSANSNLLHNSMKRKALK